MDRYGQRLVCECSTVKVDGRCPVCEPLRKPGFRRIQSSRRAREQEAGLFHSLPTMDEMSAAAARAMSRAMRVRT